MNSNKRLKLNQSKLYNLQMKNILKYTIRKTILLFVRCPCVCPYSLGAPYTSNTSYPTEDQLPLRTFLIPSLGIITNTPDPTYRWEPHNIPREPTDLLGPPYPARTHLFLGFVAITPDPTYVFAPQITQGAVHDLS